MFLNQLLSIPINKYCENRYFNLYHFLCDDVGNALQRINVRNVALIKANQVSRYIAVC
jgi:hypothetical protein